MFQKTITTAALILAVTVTAARAESDVLALSNPEDTSSSVAADSAGPTEDAPAPAAQKQTRRQKYDRGLAFDTRTPSMPKGLWVAGFNIGYSQLNTDDYRFLIIEKANITGHSLNLSPMVHYVFANNQSIGIRFAYKRNWVDIPYLKLNLTDEMNNMLFKDGHIRYRYENHTYMAYLSYRYYVGFGSSVRRLLFFNEVQLGFGGGQQRELSGEPVENSGDQYRTGTYQNSFNFRIGLSPGVSFFVTNVLAIELQIGLLGYEWKRSRQWGTNLQQSSIDSHNVSSRFDFLSVAFGTTFYL